jgi:ketosteroid isomerase-like protein
MIMKRNLFVAIVLGVGLLYGCSGNQKEGNPNLEEAKKSIAESNAIYFQAFVKGDSSIFIDRYAEDCCIMAPNAPALCGADAALKFYRMAYYEFGLRNGKFITTQVYGLSDEYVTEEGFWQSFDANNVMMDDGKFLVLWKKTPKGWKMFRDSFSSNREIPFGMD